MGAPPVSEPLPDRAPSSPLTESLAGIAHSLEALRLQLRDISDQGPSGPAPADPRADVTAPIEIPGLATLGEALAVPTMGYPAEQVFAMAMERLARLLEVDRAVLLLQDAETGHLVPRGARGFRRDDLTGMSVAPGSGLLGRTFQSGTAHAYSRPPDTAPRDPFIAQFPVRDGVAVPVRSDGQVIGVLYVGRRGRGGGFTDDELQLLSVVADRVAIAAANQDLVERAGAHLSRLRELHGFAGQTLVGGDLVETLVRACEVGCRLLHVRVAAVVLPDGHDGVRLVAVAGLPGARVSEWRGDRARGLVGEVWGAQQPLVLRDLRARQGEIEEFLREPELRGCLVVPLRVHGRTTGAMYLADDQPQEFGPDEIEASQVLASLCALAVENDRLYREVRSAFEAVSQAQEHLVQSEKARALGEMAGGVAHEFNNILAIILGKTQLLLGRVIDDGVREGLGHVEEAAWRAADIVRRMQGFAATRSGEATDVVDVNTLAHDAITLTRGLWKDEAEAQGIRVEVITDLEDVPLVHGNATELREAVTNLVLNAIDAMSRGGRLRLSTRTQDRGVSITVVDTGEGMSTEVRRRIFDPFFSTRSPRRTGLGLSVVQGIVSRHGGWVEVASEPGQGTTVTLWLPAASQHLSAAPAPAPSAARGDEAPAAPSDEPLSVLVIEDEEQIRSMLVDALQRAGHHVDAAADGLTGLARVQSGRFDGVLTDLSLPEKSGLEVARAVKGLRPDTPVVLVTGWGHALDPVRLRESGVDLTLVKPFRLSGVLAVLADAMRLRRAG